MDTTASAAATGGGDALAGSGAPYRVQAGPHVDRTAAIGPGTADVILKAGPGRLRRVLVTAAGSGGGITFHDDASGHSGAVIAAIPAAAPANTLYVFDEPAAAGIACRPAADGPAVTVSFA